MAVCFQSQLATERRRVMSNHHLRLDKPWAAAFGIISRRGGLLLAGKKGWFSARPPTFFLRELTCPARELTCPRKYS